jgi:hypothetical protein
VHGTSRSPSIACSATGGKPGPEAALRRLAATKITTVARGLAAIYRATVGLLVAVVVLSLFALRRRPARPGRAPAG